MQILFKRQALLSPDHTAQQPISINMLVGITWGVFLFLALGLTGCAQQANTSFTPTATARELGKNPPLICAPSSSTLAYLNDLLLKEMQALYAIPAKELPQEIANLERQNNAHAKLKLALLLTRTQQATNTQRALTLLEEIQAQTQDINNAWYVWAQLLYPIIAEQHTLNVRLAQQGRILRENTKQIEELKQKLSDLRAIEQSLRTRPE